jgi:hypothetical protein
VTLSGELGPFRTLRRVLLDPEVMVLVIERSELGVLESFRPGLHVRELRHSAHDPECGRRRSPGWWFALESFPPADSLRVRRILDLHPARHITRHVSSVLPFGDDTFQGTTTDFPVEFRSLSGDVSGVQEPRRRFRDKLTEQTLALDQRKGQSRNRMAVGIKVQILWLGISVFAYIAKVLEKMRASPEVVLVGWTKKRPFLDRAAGW